MSLEARGVIYLDHHATTPIDPRVLEAMQPYLTIHFGNAASKTHRLGWVAEEAVEKAREQVAALVSARPSEIIFTSGATESNNLAIFGAARAYALSSADLAVIAAAKAGGTFKVPERLEVHLSQDAEELEARRRDHFVTMTTEHKSVLDPMKALRSDGYVVDVLAVRPDGSFDLDSLKASVGARTVLVSAMFANNEIGVINPPAELSTITRPTGALLHVDAAQAAGRVPIDVDAEGIDLLSLSAHKLYGPKGVGALYVRRRSPRVSIAPIILGGGHERGLRSGTLNVAGIVGFGEAARIASSELEAESRRLAGLRDQLLEGLLSSLAGVVVHGRLMGRLPNNLSVSFENVEGEALILSLRDLALSSGSACTSATQEPSHVLRALGVSDELAHGSVRFGLGRTTTSEEIDAAIGAVAQSVRRLRAQ